MKDVVVVQQLRVEACPEEKQLFLEEGRASAILGLIPAPERHPNVLAMVGCCLEKPPLILTYEFCPNGDLKTFLRKNRGNFCFNNSIKYIPKAQIPNFIQVSFICLVRKISPYDFVGT
jgi:hypothetical protein